MRIRVAYETLYDYETPVRSAIQVLRLTPRGHAGQRVSRWRVQVDADGRLRQSEDGFGNLVHTFYLGRPARDLRILAEGEAEVTDTAGVLSGALERLPPHAYLRDTPLTAHTPAVAALAASAAAQAQTRLDQLHALMRLVGARVAFDADATGTATTADQALALGHGVCQDMTHVFLAAARTLGAPARYVSGHLLRADGVTEQAAAHAWAEAHVEGLGWVGFDCANGVCPTEAHLRVAVGLDYLSAAPVRGSRSGGGVERMTVRLSVKEARRPA